MRTGSNVLAAVKVGLYGERGEALCLWGQALDLDVPDRLKRLEEAVQAFAKALAIAPDSANLAWIYDAKGAALTAVERYADALSAFDQALQRDASCTWAYIDRGKAYYFLRQFPQAQQAFEHVLTLEARF